MAQLGNTNNGGLSAKQRAEVELFKRERPAEYARIAARADGLGELGFLTAVVSAAAKYAKKRYSAIKSKQAKVKAQASAAKKAASATSSTSTDSSTQPATTTADSGGGTGKTILLVGAALAAKALLFS